MRQTLRFAMATAMAAATPAMMPAMALALLLAGTGAAPAGDYRIGAIQISHPWAPPTPETARDAPGYLTITNTGSVPDRLISGSFIDAAQLEIHSTGAAGGRARMRRVEGLAIGPGETVTLRPGGDHLVVIGLKGPLRAGMSAQSILRFERSGAGPLEFAVEGGPPRGRAAGARPATSGAETGAQAPGR